MTAETVPATEQEEVIEQLEAVQEEQAPVEAEEKHETVPLHVHIKERRKRQELEQRIRELEEARQAPQNDADEYEPVTKRDLESFKKSTLREAKESSWMAEYPERAELVNQQLEEFLRKRPNLAAAIEAAPNRYAEAWELMDKLSPKQKAALRPAPLRKDAPGSPASVPKAAALNETVDLMQMSDAEYMEWRKAQKRKR